MCFTLSPQVKAAAMLSSVEVNERVLPSRTQTQNFGASFFDYPLGTDKIWLRYHHHGYCGRCFTTSPMLMRPLRYALLKWRNEYCHPVLKHKFSHNIVLKFVSAVVKGRATLQHPKFINILILHAPCATLKNKRKIFRNVGFFGELYRSPYFVKYSESRLQRGGVFEER